jgi:hypothetical protein
VVNGRRVAQWTLCGDGTAMSLGALTSQAAALALGEPAPDAEFLTVGEGVLETLLSHFATSTDFFGLAGGCAALGKEEVGVDPQAIGLVLPCAVVAFRRFNSLIH